MTAARSWWAGLACRWCEKPVKVTSCDASFHYGLSDGGPWAEHHACKSAESDPHHGGER
jgi:hypothetical protein